MGRGGHNCALVYLVQSKEPAGAGGRADSVYKHRCVVFYGVELGKGAAHGTHAPPNGILFLNTHLPIHLTGM